MRVLVSQMDFVPVPTNETGVLGFPCVEEGLFSSSELHHESSIFPGILLHHLLAHSTSHQRASSSRDTSVCVVSLAVIEARLYDEVEEEEEITSEPTDRAHHNHTVYTP